jgi:hypothetical protein
LTYIKEQRNGFIQTEDKCQLDLRIFWGGGGGPYEGKILHFLKIGRQAYTERQGGLKYEIIGTKSSYMV